MVTFAQHKFDLDRAAAASCAGNAAGHQGALTQRSWRGLTSCYRQQSRGNCCQCPRPWCQCGGLQHRGTFKQFHGKCSEWESDEWSEGKQPLPSRISSNFCSRIAALFLIAANLQVHPKGNPTDCICTRLNIKCGHEYVDWGVWLSGVAGAPDRRKWWARRGLPARSNQGRLREDQGYCEGASLDANSCTKMFHQKHFSSFCQLALRNSKSSGHQAAHRHAARGKVRAPSTHPLAVAPACLKW